MAYYGGGFGGFGGYDPYGFNPDGFPYDYGDPYTGGTTGGTTGADNPDTFFNNGGSSGSEPGTYPAADGITPIPGSTVDPWQSPFSSGWGSVPNTTYKQWSAPGFGTYQDPEKMMMNLAQDARAWMSQQPQLWQQYGGPMIAGLSPLQQQARMNMSSYLGGGYGALDNAIGYAGSAASYAPERVSATPGAYAGNVTATPGAYAGDVSAGPGAYAGDVYGSTVSGGSFLGGGLDAYQDPYQQQVINTTLGDLDRSRQLANTAGARSAGASTYGGSRNALIEAETNRNYADTAARTLGQLRSQGFAQAAGLMGQDLSRGMQAGLANQQTGLSAALANQAARAQYGQYAGGLGLQAALANQAARAQYGQYAGGLGMQADLANQAALGQYGQYAGQLGMQAALANQQAGLAGNQQLLGAAGTLGGLGAQRFNMGLDHLNAMNMFGGQDQATQQALYDANRDEYFRALYSPMQGYNFLGGLMSGIGYNATPSGPGAFRGAAGGALTGLGTVASNPLLATNPMAYAIGGIGGGILGAISGR